MGGKYALKKHAKRAELSPRSSLVLGLVERYRRRAAKWEEVSRLFEEARDEVTRRGLELLREHGAMTPREFENVFYRDTPLWRKRVSTARKFLADLQGRGLASKSRRAGRYSISVAGTHFLMRRRGG